MSWLLKPVSSVVSVIKPIAPSAKSRWTALRAAMLRSWGSLSSTMLPAGQRLADSKGSTTGRSLLFSQ